MSQDSFFQRAESISSLKNLMPWSNESALCKRCNVLQKVASQLRLYRGTSHEGKASQTVYDNCSQCNVYQKAAKDLD